MMKIPITVLLFLVLIFGCQSSQRKADKDISSKVCSYVNSLISQHDSLELTIKADGVLKDELSRERVFLSTPKVTIRKSFGRFTIYIEKDLISNPTSQDDMISILNREISRWLIEAKSDMTSYKSQGSLLVMVEPANKEFARKFKEQLK